MQKNSTVVNSKVVEQHYPPSYYAASRHQAPPRPAVSSNVVVDVCVIGAGYTGLTTALHLAESGMRVCVLEAEQVGFGASGRNGGQMINSFSRDIDVIKRSVDQGSSALLARMAFEGGDLIRQLIIKYNISCDLQDGGVFAAITQKHMQHLIFQQQLWQQNGYDKLVLLDANAMQNHVQSQRYLGGAFDAGGGHFHPLNLALGEAVAFESLGGVIYENSRVERITYGIHPIVHTSQAEVQCRFMVLAGNAYLGGLVPELAAKSMPCGTQVIATQPLSDKTAKKILPSNHCVEDCNYLLDYFRLSADKRLIYGGGVVYGARNPSDIDAIIRPKLAKTFPELARIPFDYAWTGNFLLTLSRLPQMGRIHQNVYYSQGCSGHGVTFTHVAGKALSLAILGQTQDFDAFATLPHYPFPGGRLFRTPLTALGAWYYDLRDKLGI